MGLLRAAVFFLLGNFYISIIENHSHKVKEIYIFGDMFGDKTIEFIEINKNIVLLIMLSLTALVV